MTCVPAFRATQSRDIQRRNVGRALCKLCNKLASGAASTADESHRLRDPGTEKGVEELQTAGLATDCNLAGKCALRMAFCDWLSSQ